MIRRIALWLMLIFLLGYLPTNALSQRSPGEQIAFIREGDVYLFNLETGEETRLAIGDFGWMAWSPGGDQLALIDIHLTLYLMKSHEVNLRDLGMTFPASVFWSPDGSELLYAGESGITLYDTAAHTSTVFSVESLYGAYTVEADRSLDTSWMAPIIGLYPNANRSMSLFILVSRITAGAIVNTCLVKEAISPPTWSPSAQRVAFVGWTDNIAIVDVPDMIVADRDDEQTSVSCSEEREIFFDEAVRPAYLTWSLTGDEIAFSAFHNGDNSVAGIYVLDVATQETRRLTDEGYNLSPSWSGDGERLLFSRVDKSSITVNFIQSNVVGEIFVVNADGSDLERLAEGFAPAWRP